MENSPEGAAPPGGERREGLMIEAVVIPADDREPVRAAELLAGGLEDRQRLVHGDIEALDLDQPRCRLFMNEYGQQLDLPINRKTTLLTWMHHPAHRYTTVIVGDVVMVGSGRGELDTGVPEEYKRIFEAEQLKVELRLPGTEAWREHPERFGDWFSAYDNGLAWAYSLAKKASGDRGDVRVVAL